MTTLTTTQPGAVSHAEARSVQPLLQTLGGLAALVAAGTWIFGFALFVTVFEPLVSGELNAAETVAFLGANQTLVYVWNLVIYVLFGVAQVILTLAIHERLKASAPVLSQIAAALGLIWSALVIASGMVANIGTAAVVALYATDPAQAGTIWSAVDTVRNGLGGGNEIVGGLWVVLLSWAALRGGLPKMLNIAGVVFGLAGVVTIVPTLTDIGAVFGLKLIVWYIWIGVVLLSHRR